MPLARSLRRCAVLACVVALSALPASAVDEPTPVRTFRSFERAVFPRAPAATVWAFSQGGDGRLWIASTVELVVFDGRTFEPPLGGPGAPPLGAVQALARGHGGGIYAAHRGGVSLWNGTEWEAFALPGGAVGVGESEDGALWALDRSGRLRRHEAASASWSELPSRTELKWLVGSAGGGLWALGARVAYRVSGGTLVPLADGDELPDAISAAAADAKGVLWIGTVSGGIFVAGPADRYWRRAPTAPCKLTFPRDIEADATGRIWIGDNSGVLCFGDENDGWREWGPANGLKPAAILDVFFDREGSLWLGYNGRGLQQQIAPEWSHRDRWSDADPPDQQTLVTDVAASGNGGFLATVMARGLWRWDGAEMHRYGATQGLVTDTMAAFEPAVGELWVGARRGLYELREGRFVRTLELPSGFVSGFFRSPAGVDYATTIQHGVYRRTAGTWRPEEAISARLLDPDVRTLLWASTGELWVATRDGVAILDGPATRYLPAAGRSMPSTVSDVIERIPGEFWIAGTGGVRVTGTAERFLTEADGLPGSFVSSLATTRDGAVWLLGAGVTRLDSAGAVRRFDDLNGLLAANGSLGGLWVDGADNVYVAMQGALSRFEAHLATPRPPPPLSLAWKGGPGVAGEHLEAGQRSATWSWSAPSLLPGKVEYRVRIPGIMDAWGAGHFEPRLVLPNLPVGRWRVEVAARRAEAAWSAPLTVEFAVPARWFETVAARAVFILATLALLVGLAQLRVERQRVRSAQALRLQHLAAEARLAILRNQIRPHFLFNALHGISSLTSRDARAARRMIVRLSDLLRLSLAQDTRDEITVAEEIEIVERYLDLQRMRFEERLAVTIAVEPECTAELVPSFLLQPLVENAIRHGIERREGQGAIRIAVGPASGRLRITVSDNGPGFARSELRGIGLGNVRERLALLYGDEQNLRLGNLPSGGAVVQIEIPLASAQRAARPAG